MRDDSTANCPWAMKWQIGQVSAEACRFVSESRVFFPLGGRVPGRFVTQTRHFVEARPAQRHRRVERDQRGDQDLACDPGHHESDGVSIEDGRGRGDRGSRADGAGGEPVERRAGTNDTI